MGQALRDGFDLASIKLEWCDRLIEAQSIAAQGHSLKLGPIAALDRSCCHGMAVKMLRLSGVIGGEMQLALVVAVTYSTDDIDGVLDMPVQEAVTLQSFVAFGQSI
jgi:hypothetical protein